MLDYWGSGLYVNRYIEKHGTSKLTREVLAWAYSEEELNQLEIAFIAAGKKMEAACGHANSEAEPGRLLLLLLALSLKSIPSRRCYEI